jgi:hypothetical protein
MKIHYGFAFESRNPREEEDIEVYFRTPKERAKGLKQLKLKKKEVKMFTFEEEKSALGFKPKYGTRHLKRRLYI